MPVHKLKDSVKVAGSGDGEIRCYWALPRLGGVASGGSVCLRRTLSGLWIADYSVRSVGTRWYDVSDLADTMWVNTLSVLSLVFSLVLGTEIDDEIAGQCQIAD